MSKPGQPATIELTVPAGRDWDRVVRLLLGGIADRLRLSFEELDDLQLAVERLLLEAGSEGEVRLSFYIEGDRLHARVRPLCPTAVTAALGAPADPGPVLTLRRILETVVDSFAVEDAEDGAVAVRLEKTFRP